MNWAHALFALGIGCGVMAFVPGIPIAAETRNPGWVAGPMIVATIAFAFAWGLTP